MQTASATPDTVWVLFFPPFEQRFRKNYTRIIQRAKVFRVVVKSKIRVQQYNAEKKNCTNCYICDLYRTCFAIIIISVISDTTVLCTEKNHLADSVLKEIKRRVRKKIKNLKIMTTEHVMLVMLLSGNRV